MPVKKTRKKQPGFGRRHSLALLIAVIAVVALAGGAAAIAFVGYRGSEAQWVYLEGTESRAAVRDTLRSRLGTSMGTRVWLLWRAQGGTLHRGAYRIEPGQSAVSAARRLEKGRQTPLRFTFNNLRTPEQLAERAARRLDFTPQQFLDACDSILGHNRALWAASFMPDTYEVLYTISPAELVHKLAGATESFWNDERRRRADTLGLTPAQVATLASIVEEETAKGDERPLVARLYLNRLHRRMPLQADPTVKYAIGDFSIRRITHAMLRTPSPYNTYLNTGLPPGPIRLVEGATIDAVLAAPQHDYLYMCARDDFSGYHNFAATYAEHRDNARRYQQALNRRNIR